MAPDFTTQLFLDDINANGDPFRWLRARRSSARNPLTGANDTTIVDSRAANLRIYEEQAVPATAAFLVISKNVLMATPQFGQVRIGDLRGAVDPNAPNLIRPAGQDIFILTNREEPLSAVYVRTAGTLFDTLLGSATNEPVPPVTSIDTVRAGTHVYVQGTDYQLSGNRIEWLSGGSRPADGAKFAVDLLYNPLYENLNVNAEPLRRGPGGVYYPLHVTLAMKQIGGVL